MRIIGQKFKEQIKQSNMNYLQFGERVGLSKQAMNHYLNHKADSDWKYADISKWCYVLHINVEEFLRYVDKER